MTSQKKLSIANELKFYEENPNKEDKRFYELHPEQIDVGALKRYPELENQSDEQMRQIIDVRFHEDTPNGLVAQYTKMKEHLTSLKGLGGIIRDLEFYEKNPKEKDKRFYELYPEQINVDALMQYPDLADQSDEQMRQIIDVRFHDDTSEERVAKCTKMKEHLTSLEELVPIAEEVRKYESNHVEPKDKRFYELHPEEINVAALMQYPELENQSDEQMRQIIDVRFHECAPEERVKKCDEMKEHVASQKELVPISEELGKYVSNPAVQKDKRFYELYPEQINVDALMEYPDLADQSYEKMRQIIDVRFHECAPEERVKKHDEMKEHVASQKELVQIANELGKYESNLEAKKDQRFYELYPEKINDNVSAQFPDLAKQTPAEREKIIDVRFRHLEKKDRQKDFDTLCKTEKILNELGASHKKKDDHKFLDENGTLSMDSEIGKKIKSELKKAEGKSIDNPYEYVRDKIKDQLSNPIKEKIKSIMSKAVRKIGAGKLDGLTHGRSKKAPKSSTKGLS